MSLQSLNFEKLKPVDQIFHDPKELKAFQRFRLACRCSLAGRALGC